MADKRTKIDTRRIFADPVCLLAFGFGSGLAPKAPGTFGTLAAIPLYLAAATLPVPAYAAVTALMFAAGIWICGRCERTLQVEDHSGIVWDEFVGFFITMTAMPLNWPTVLCGFALFRLFDVLKPWPIRHLERNLHGGLGVMMDDVLAGAFAWSVLFLMRPWLPT
jgi:phosphatidylglycerophosphatase A